MHHGDVSIRDPPNESEKMEGQRMEPSFSHSFIQIVIFANSANAQNM